MTNLTEYVRSALSEPLPRPPRDYSNYQGYRGNGVWSQFKTAEERSQYARELVAQRKSHKGGRPHGVPHGWTAESIDKVKATVAGEVDTIVCNLIADNKLDTSDAKTLEQVRDALTLVRMPGQARKRQAAAKRLLRHFGDGAGLLV